MTRVVVVGGGISGLAAAERLASALPDAGAGDAEVVVLEASDRVGGKLRRVQVGGAWIDVGAEAMLARRPEGLALADRAGLADQLIHPLTASAWLRSRGANRPLPAGTVMGVPGNLDTLAAAGILSDDALARVAAEPAGGPYPPLAGDVSVGDLVADRFGEEVVQRLVEPLLGGVYAGHAHAISLRAAVPMLADRLAAQGGSLLAAAAANVAAGGRETSTLPVFASVRGGLARLAETVAASPALTVRTSATVRTITRTASGFSIELGSAADPERMSADAVLLATPAGKSATLLAGLAPQAADELAGIQTASMAIVTLAFTVPTGGSLPAGSGMLIPTVEGLNCKAMTFSSQKWPGVGDEAGVLLLRASLGRAGEQWALQREDSELVAVVRAELGQLTGLADRPVDQHVQRWGGALPQYAVGHRDRVDRVRTAVARVAGLAVCGASYDGVGIAACIGSAHRAADRIVSALARPAQ